MVTERPCPDCGKEMKWDLDCPGYPNRDGTTMMCWPVCGNAEIVECEGCGYWYREPNNRGTTNYKGIEMGAKPEWFVLHD
jgi:predicted RNA-binding Zn-ribbon protein involved in translation (DUF1610 family)